jgi:sulfatase modifying factor 1
VASFEREELTDALAPLEGGEFMMGTDFAEGYPRDGEGPVHRVRLGPFGIDPHAVTNDRFAAFADATSHVTDAERYGWSFVFGGLLPDDFEDTRGVAESPWWRQVHAADWRHPEGPQSDLGGRGDHPVVHVSWNDAQAYCGWSGTRLPTEAEWEYAARGGLEGARFPWGDELRPGRRWPLNIWQGRFPTHNTMEDGFATTAPVKSYRPNGHGLWQMAGNVWEWCADRFSPQAYQEAAPIDPVGPAVGEARVMRGGSYLCHESYCYRYRVAARSSNTPDSSSGNLGFRCAGSGT